MIIDRLGVAAAAAIPVVVLLVAALFINRLAAWLLRQASRHGAWAGFVHRLWPAVEPLVYLMALGVGMDRAPVSPPLATSLRHAWALALVAAFCWLALRALAVAEALVRERHPGTAADNLVDRRIQTQTRVLVIIARIVVVTLGASVMLMTFPAARALGASLLASAGIAGIVVGVSARPVLTNLLAGLQLGLTQPLRLDDVVIVQGEWGRIEEITSTYVVVRIWDQRRLIVPLTWFIENPFQNWTHTSAELLGSVYLWVDYRTPMPPLRAELERLCRITPDWDGRVVGLVVTDANERAVQIRALVSAADSSRAWNLRCAVREGLVDFLQRNYPDCLPRFRGEWTDHPAAGRRPSPVDVPA